MKNEQFCAFCTIRGRLFTKKKPLEFKIPPAARFYTIVPGIIYRPSITRYPFVNATMFDRYLPFSCPLNTFVTDAVRFPPFHHH
ncbi:hypothetical protein ACRW16_11105, partial [Escherichia coli]